MNLKSDSLQLSRLHMQAVWERLLRWRWRIHYASDDALVEGARCYVSLYGASFRRTTLRLPDEGSAKRPYWSYRQYGRFKGDFVEEAASAADLRRIFELLERAIIEEQASPANQVAATVHLAKLIICRDALRPYVVPLFPAPA